MHQVTGTAEFLRWNFGIVLELSPGWSGLAVTACSGIGVTARVRHAQRRALTRGRETEGTCAMAAAERLPLLKGGGRVPVHAPAPVGRAAYVRVLVCCVALAVVAAATARLFPRGVAGRPNQGAELVGGSVATGLYKDEEDGATLAPVHVTTHECTGDTSKAVVLGADVVAYRSLTAGHHAVYGSKEFSSVYGRYLFYFSSLENQLEFESNPVRYLPAFGGFCSYGISREIIWNENNLGPASNPDFWLIYDDQLYLFRSATPFGKFQGKATENIAHGRSVWTEWFGDDADTATTPFNTACFCSEATCSDG